MPELTEVQTVVNHLKSQLIGRRILNIEIIWPKVLDNFKPEELFTYKSNLKVNDVFRRAKFIIIQLDFYILAIHLRMTGKLHIIKDEPFPKHTSSVINLDNNYKLIFEDVRKFGRIYLYRNLDVMNSKYGIEPLSNSFSSKLFQDLILTKKRNIKGLLLDQSIISGLGNIYVDESLWMSGIHPNSISCSISKPKLKRLHESIISILQEAIASKGTTIIDFSVNGESGRYSSQLRVYGKKGHQCLNCKNNIIKLRVCGRGTYVCKKMSKNIYQEIIENERETKNT